MAIQDLFNLTGKVAVVTGGHGLLGQPISEALAEAGAHVVIAARNQAKSNDWVKTLVGRGLKASAEVLDQSQESSILKLRDSLVRQFKAIDIVVNNSVHRSMRRYSDDLQTWRESMEVNSTGVFCICRAFLAQMIAQQRGSMINIGSIQSVCAPRFRNYAGTDKTTPPDYHFHKHGLIGLTKYLAAWAGPRNVRVNAVSPGGFNPEGFTDPFLSQYLSNCLLPRMMQYDDVKGAVLFLASDASGYVTGQNIVVDGGYSV